jgi:hypothetical protein
MLGIGKEKDDTGKDYSVLRNAHGSHADERGGAHFIPRARHVLGRSLQS